MASIGTAVVAVSPVLDMSTLIAQLRKLADLLESQQPEKAGE